MRNESHRSKLATLMYYVDLWRVRVGSREAVALAIVEAHQRFGMPEVTGIRFETNGDPFTLAKNAADRIFRWLDDKTKESNFMPMNFEQSVLAAMPNDLRYGYVCEILRPFGYSPRMMMSCPDGEFDPSKKAQTVLKENTEATLALIALSENASDEAHFKAHKELCESIGTARGARAAIEQVMLERGLVIPND